MNILFPSGKATFLFPGLAGNLEVATTCPADSVPQVVAIICHPHPLQGGTMHNKVVTTLVRTFISMGCATLRFNFRGVGQSEGEHAAGLGEAQDLISILEWVQTVFPAAKIILAGFSFGSYVAYRVATQSDVAAKIHQLVLIAPPAIYPEFAQLPEPTMPWWVVQGESDEVIPPEAVFTWLAGFKHQATLIRMPETSHFFHGKLIDLKQRLLETLA
jgi:alpha/beta superfamily hydrolase